ncbi:Metallo-dependent hydrolase [Agrocybe pediades]|nr:Metallo-dependent hydrolase [Agrocybe pediades]
MGRKSASIVQEEHLLVTAPAPAPTPIIDTHAHYVLTYELYREKFKDGKHLNAFEFFKAMHEGRNVKSVLDVWCVPPFRDAWREYADAGPEKWGGLEYWFIMGVHPHDSKMYTDEVEKLLLEAMEHPRCVALGEIGLDYHYDHSPREIQRDIFVRQLRHAVRLGKPLTIHIREADDDAERILKAEVPKDHKIHIHCFTDAPELAQKLLDYFPNLYIGITGVITYSSNPNTSNVIRNMVSSSTGPHPTPLESSLRILLETDAPFMVPTNVQNHLPAAKRKKLPLSHIEGEELVEAASSSNVEGAQAVAGSMLDAETVMRISNANAWKVYGV